MAKSVPTPRRSVLPRAWEALGDLAYRGDKVLEKVAGKPLDRLFEENTQRAMQDPTYAAIEARRVIPGTDNKILASDVLGWGDWETQLDIRQKVSRNPFWTRPARALTRHPLGRVWGTVTHAYQRLIRGWDDSATWNLDSHLCRTLGDQLAHLAESGTGWPSGEEFPEAVDWENALRANGAALLAYANRDYPGVPVNPDDEAEFEAWKANQEKSAEDAKAALRWVADHLGSLWD